MSSRAVTGCVDNELPIGPLHGCLSHQGMKSLQACLEHCISSLCTGLLLSSTCMMSLQSCVCSLSLVEYKTITPLARYWYCSQNKGMHAIEPHLTLGQQVAAPPQAFEGQKCSHRQILIGSSLCQGRTRVQSVPALVSMLGNALESSFSCHRVSLLESRPWTC